MSKRYENPPLIEALCEFQFDSDVLWDLTLLGPIYEKLKGIFPKRQQLQISEINEQVGVTPMIPLVRFLDQDGKALIQVGQNLLTVNHLKPYPSWEEFFSLVEKGFIAYLEVAHPKKLLHLGIRYINRIQIPGSRINLENYLKFRPFLSQDLPQDVDEFFMDVHIPYEGSRDTLRIQLTTTTPEVPDALAMILEISYVFVKPGEIPLDGALSRIGLAHKHIQNAFESCITDELRQMFEEVGE